MKGSPRRLTLTHEFVEFVPEQLAEGVLYISPEFGTVAHRCFCGCGREVATPLSPTDWEVTFDGETVSLWPSIGNWGFPCKSHYWIKNNRVQWSFGMSETLISEGRVRDRQAKDRYYRARRGIRAAGAGIAPGAPVDGIDEEF